MAKLTFIKLAEKILRQHRKPLSPSEMWALALAKGYDKTLESKGKTPSATLYSAVFTNARNTADSLFVKLGSRPARYFLKDLMPTKQRDIDKLIASLDDVQRPSQKFDEADLHPFLAYYSRLYFKAHTKTIRHSTSKKKSFGEWVHPDMIGVYYAAEEWDSDVLKLSTATGNPSVKLYSFEIKKYLSFSNLREAFFQAVSNSSWAHEGYLVAADISTDEDFRSELKRLSASFGIGVIHLTIDDPDSTEIVVPSREKDVVDWDTVNKLTMNKDVRELLTRIRNDMSTSEIIKEKYDAVLTPKDLISQLKQKNY